MPHDDHHAEREVTITNQQGFHARPITKFVDLANGFQSAIRVLKGPQSVDAKSPMEMMLLAATCGTKLRIVARGSDAAAAVDALVKLIDSKFGED